MICKSVLLKYGAPEPPYFAAWHVDESAVVKLATVFGVADFCYAHPRYTEIYRVYDVKTERVGRHVVAYVYKFGGELHDVYVFDGEVYDAVYKFANDALYAPEKARGHLLILHGPPGTGKSSLAYLLPSVLNAPYEMVSLAQILSKYVGVSERKLLRIVASARETASRGVPNIVVFEEADILVAKGGHHGGGEGYGHLVSNLQNVLKKELQEVTNEEEPVLFVVTTNLSADDIEPAFVRSGRGSLVHVPYLDREGVSLLVSRLAAKHGVAPPPDAVDAAVRNRLSPADISYWLRELSHNPKAEPPSHNAYKHCARFPQRRVRPLTSWCRQKRECKCPEPGEHYYVVVEDVHPFEKLCRVLQYLSENCDGAVPLLSLDRDDVDRTIRKAVQTKTALVVLPDVDAAAYMAKFAQVTTVFFQPPSYFRAIKPLFNAHEICRLGPVHDFRHVVRRGRPSRGASSRARWRRAV